MFDLLQSAAHFWFVTALQWAIHNIFALIGWTVVTLVAGLVILGCVFGVLSGLVSFTRTFAAAFRRHWSQGEETR